MKSLSFKILVRRALVLATLTLATCRPYQDARLAGRPDLQPGDMIFLDLDCGPLCDAIENVTLEQFDVKGPRLSHIGIYAGNGEILEAWPKGGVRTTTIDEFLGRVTKGENQANGFYLGYLKPEFKSLGEAAVWRIKTQLGKPYNDSFEWHKGRFYCSELVSYGYGDLTRDISGDGKGLFSPRPMFFGKKDSKDFAQWKSYFQELGVDMPSNEPGISPLGIYLEGQKRLFRTE